jgi:electron transfer flavoprotein alpha subunit
VILVVAEQRDGRLNRATLETIAAAQTLAGADPITVAVVGAAAKAAGDLAGAAGVSEVLTVEHPALDAYTPDGFAQGVIAVIERVSPTHVLLPHTYQTRDFAPLIAARLRCAIVTDVTGVSGQGAEATFTRPMFQGKLVAQVRPQGDPPWIVTCQIGAFRADAVRMGEGGRVTPFTVALDPAAIRQRPEVPFQEARQAVDLSQAERIVAVGRGIKSEDNLPVAQRLARALGAELAASRPICDSGWMPMDRQVGSSGQTVAPKLYVALGISGAIQHLVGMKGSRTIVAINKDADAPIFEVADYGIVGDLFELVPAISAELEKA